ncbi:MAG: L,D-transpeptidase family protein [Bdellovibrionales bacterium]|nr:L,D-transpeptidase family protein [Bdellovibrionales bacterium]
MLAKLGPTFSVAAALLAAAPLAWGAPEPGRPTVILVDKKSNTLELAYYGEPEYVPIKTYHTTIGRVVGDKEEEGDLKTPEGVYHFTALLRPPALKAKFGLMALYMNYPNPFDDMAGRTGSHIMLHATDQPERLEKDFDSEGCVVVKNEEIEQIEPYVKLNLTPILVFQELAPEWRRPLGDGKVKAFFESWIKDWESKSLAAYIKHYHSEFRSAGMDKKQWETFKGGLNSRYEKITINPTQIQYYRHPKYTVVFFKQDYRSTFKGGSAAYTSIGTKMLHVAEEDGDLRIISEHFTRTSW